MKTDGEITMLAAVHFFGLEGATEPVVLHNAEQFPFYEHQTAVRHSDRHIVSCPAPQHINKRYPDPLNDDRDNCILLDWFLDNIGGFQIVTDRGAARRRIVVMECLKAKGVEVE